MCLPQLHSRARYIQHSLPLLLDPQPLCSLYDTIRPLHLHICMRPAASLVARGSMAMKCQVQGRSRLVLMPSCPSCHSARPLQPIIPRPHARRPFSSSQQRCDAHGSASQIARIQEDIGGGKSAVEVVRQYLSNADAQEPILQSFISLDAEGALKQVSVHPQPACM